MSKSRRSTGTLLWRWFSGHALDGQHRTNATWTMPSRGDRPVLHPTGHAVRWHHLTRLHRAGIRKGSTLAALAAVYGLATAFLPTVVLLPVVAGGATGYGGWRAYRWLRGWRHHRRWVRPLHRVLTPVLGAPQGTCTRFACRLV